MPVKLATTQIKVVAGLQQQVSEAGQEQVAAPGRPS